MAGSDLEPRAERGVVDVDDLVPRLRPRMRPLLIVGVVAVVLMVATFVLGLSIRGSDDQAYENSLRHIYTTADVELHTEGAVLTEGTAEGGATLEILAALPDGTAIAQISAEPVPVGGMVTAGSVLTALSGRPVFALPIASPYFRDLQLYDSGGDVAALNVALGSLGYDVDTDSSEFSWETADAVAELYEAAGYDALTADARTPITPGREPSAMPVGSLLPFAEVAPMAAGAMVVTSTSPKFDVVEEGTPIMSLSSAVVAVKARVNALDQRQVSVGQKVGMTVPGTEGSIAGSVASISDFIEVSADADLSEQTTLGSGYDVVVTIDDPATVPFANGEVVTLTFASDAEEYLAVPATAIQQQGAVTFVWKASGKNFDRVEVAVRRISDGWALLEGSDNLAQGDAVRVG